MFINCPHCQALVATDPATDQPPARCPRCDEALGDPGSAPAADRDASTAPGPSAPIASALAGAIARETGSEAELAEEAAALAAAGQDPAAALAAAAAPARANDDDTVPAAEPEPGAAEATAPPAVAAGTGADTAPGAAEPAVVETDASNADSVAGSDIAAGTGTGGSAADAVATDCAADSTTTAATPCDSGRDDPDDPDAGTPDGAPVPTAGDGRAATAPSFARFRARAAAPAGSRRWGMAAVAAGLALLLAGQWLVADRARLAADARWRPVVVRACALLRCSVPAWHEPSAIVLLERDVRPHPRRRDALQVSATFRNDARWPQRWPRLLLTLTDVDGRAVGARSFEAREYLGGTPPRALIASGQTAVVRLEIHETAPRSVAFSFDFR